MRTMAIITSSGIIYRNHGPRDGMALLMECPPARAHRSFPSREQAREWAEEWIAAHPPIVTKPCPICGAPADKDCQDDHGPGSALCYLPGCWESRQARRYELRLSRERWADEAAREARAAEYLRLAPEREREAKAREDERRADTARFLLDGELEAQEREAHMSHWCSDCGTDKCSRIAEQRARQARIAELERAIADETAHIHAAIA